MKLEYSYRIRLSKDDKKLIDELKKRKIKPTTFIRNAFREKIKNELPIIIEREEKRKSKEYCPF